MNGATIMVQALQAHHIDTIFGYPGGAIMPFYDALVDSDIQHILCRHEQAAALAAGGYARSTGNVGVCVATSGPGATNLVTGIADAYMDSTPLVVITGQAASPLIGTDAFQETDVLGMTLGIVKHSYLVQAVEELPEVIAEAFALAGGGRPGPVLIDIPKDVQLEAASIPHCITMGLQSPEVTPDEAALLQAERLIEAAQKPVIYSGGGVLLAGAVDTFRAFVEATEIPTVVTLHGVGNLPASHPLNLGMLGMHGARCANQAVQDCDLLICIGARFDDRATGKLNTFAPNAKVIHFDIDPSETGKLRQPDVSLIGDLNDLLPRLHVKPSIDAWRTHCRASTKTDGFQSPDISLNAPLFLSLLSTRADEDTFICCDVGQHQMWVAQYYAFSHPSRHLSSGGLGTMGFGLPAAIGTQLAHPDATVINITGDGSFMMNVQELATIKRYQLPIKIVIFDNQRLGMVKQQQDLFYGERHSEVDLSDNPEFIKVAEAFGIPAWRVESANALDEAIDALLNTAGPLLLHIPIHENHGVWPIVKQNAANTDIIEENFA